MNAIKAVKTVWEVQTFDVWGNEDDGYEVNNTFADGEFELTIAPEVFNGGTPSEFYVATPTDSQIRKLLGVRCAIETDGDDVCIDVERARDGRPLGRLVCKSHTSLSWGPGNGPRAAD